MSSLQGVLSDFIPCLHCFGGACLLNGFHGVWLGLWAACCQTVWCIGKATEVDTKIIVYPLSLFYQRSRIMKYEYCRDFPYERRGWWGDHRCPWHQRSWIRRIRDNSDSNQALLSFLPLKQDLFLRYQKPQSWRLHKHPRQRQ